MSSSFSSETGVPFRTIFYKHVTSNVTDPNFQILYDYWNTIPSVKEIMPLTDDVLSHPIRQAILNIMRIGIIEQNPEKTIKKFRHVFTPRELTHFIPYITGSPIKNTNTYYHIQILRENGFIQPIATIKKGRNKFTYYGRTGKIFLYTKTVPYLPITPLLQTSFINLIKEINPKLDENKILTLIEKQNNYTHQNYEKIKQWILDHAQAITNSHIDIRFLFEYFEYLFTINPEIQLINKQVLDLLDFEDLQ